MPKGTFAGHDLTDFMALLGLAEVEPRDTFEHGWDVRWFRAPLPLQEARVTLHLVEGDPDNKVTGFYDQLVLGHFCVTIPPDTVEQVKNIALRKRWLERDSGSGRFWLRFANLRVEVRPDAQRRTRTT